MLSRYANKYNHYSDEPHGVINHRNVTVCSTAYSGEHQRKQNKSCELLALSEGNTSAIGGLPSGSTGESFGDRWFPAQKGNNTESAPVCHDVIPDIHSI